MPYHPNRSAHRALTALSQGPMAWEDLISVIDPAKAGKACSKALKLKTEGLFVQRGTVCEITPRGSDVLEFLADGQSYPPFRQTVRLFSYGRGVGA